MTSSAEVTNINNRLLEVDVDFSINDRRQFYLEHFDLTGSAAAIFEGHIR